MTAMRHALDDERDPLIEALLDRPGRASLEALVNQWDALSDPQRFALTKMAQGHQSSLKKLARSP
jgi:hypothetical protein